jgi:hypothetical protein
MAEVRSKSGRHRVWPWVLALLALALLIVSAGEMLSSGSSPSAVHRPPARRDEPAAAAPAGARRPDTSTRDPRLDEALRIRSRVTA